jgi:Ran GTPase-activating protein (RanGAP) involved in mRNA processing and transport
LTKSDCHIDHRHSKLTQLQLPGSGITDFGVSLLTQFLKSPRGICLQELDLRENRITPAGISKICEVLGNEACNQLVVLKLGLNEIGDDGLRVLCGSLKRNHHRLKELNLYCCALTTESIFCLVEVLSDEHSEITRLILGRNKIGDEGVRMLCGVFIEGQCNLDVLDISRCFLTHECMPYLSEALANEMCMITHLSLMSNYDIGDDGVGMFFRDLIVEQCSLTKLDLRECSLTEKCMTALCEALGNEHCRLTNLKLSANRIGDDGARMLCCALMKGQCKLTVLDIGYCSLTDECMPLLCEALGNECCKLTDLELGLNYFTDKYLSSLSDTLKLEHCYLENLDVGSCNFTDEGEKSLKKVESSEYCKARGFTIYI